MDIAALQGTLREFAAELLRLAEHASIPLHHASGEKTHVLVDWENVQPDEVECRALVPDATDVWLFHGPNQKNVGRGYETFGERMTSVRIARTGKNALDFHLAFYMGYIAAKHPGSRLVVLSNDKGYGPMLDHAKQLGFVASQSGFGELKPARTPRKATVKKTIAKKTTAKRAPARKVATPTPAARKSAAKKIATAPKRMAAKKSAPTHKQPVVKSTTAPAESLAAPARKATALAKTARGAINERRHKPVAAPRHGRDQVRPEQLAQCAQLHCEGGVIDYSTRPEQVSQLVAADDSLPPLDQRKEQVEGVFAERSGFAVDEKLALLRQHGVATEAVRGTASLGPQPKRAHRLGDVLQRLLARVVEAVPDTAGDRAVHCLRDHHAARFAQRLQSRRDVDSIAVDAAVGLLQHIA
jgi:hypothetical protein